MKDLLDFIDRNPIGSFIVMMTIVCYIGDALSNLCKRRDK